MLHAFLSDLSFHDLTGELIALLQVLMIDLVLAGDNAVAVGMSAAGLPHKDRRRVIMAGLAFAVVLRITFAVLATRLLGVIGLTFGGGLAEHAPPPPVKSFAAALLQITLADLSMSLDNVLAVAGAAGGSTWVLAAGLTISVVLMGVVAGVLARILERQRWIAWVGLAIVFYVALHMIWQGARAVAGTM